MAKRLRRFETQFGDPSQEQRWLAELQRVGPETVRVRLKQDHHGSRAALRGIGLPSDITKGFAEDWLRYKDDVRRRWRIAGWVATSIVGVAAVLAAVADAR